MCAKDNSHATILFPFQKVPLLSSSTAKVTAKLLATPLGTRSMKIFSPAFCDLLFPAFFLWVEDLPSSRQQGGQDLACGYISPGEISWGCGYPGDILECSEFKSVLKSHL